MGVNLSHPTVFEEPLKIRYRANSIGARVCELIGLLVTLIIPFIICLAMSAFWTQYNVFTDHPQIDFTERCLVKYSTVEGGQKLWACSDALNEALIGDERETDIGFSYFSDDHDGDNKTDYITFTVQLPLTTADSDGLTSFEFLPEFSFAMSNYPVQLKFVGAPFVTLRDSGADGSRVVKMDGDLMYKETQLVESSAYVRYDRVYSSSYFDEITNVAAANNVGLIASQYSHNNQSLTFANTVVMFGDLSLLPSMGNGAVNDMDAADMVTVIVKMRVVEAHVAYRPGAGEVLKQAWVQYFCVAYVIHWIVSWVRWLFVKQALINTIAVWEGKNH